MKYIYLTYFLVLTSFAVPNTVQAQQKPNDGIENLYRGTSHEELAAGLLRAGDSRFKNNDTFFSGDNGCPNEISIGSIQEGSNVFGSIDINVNLQNDIIINCGRL